jgi:hypothetical protein
MSNIILLMSETEPVQVEEKPKDFSPGHDGQAPADTGKKKRSMPWKPAAGFAAVAILFFAIGFFSSGLLGGNATGMATAGGNFLTAQQAGEKSVQYINNYLLQPGFAATLLGANESNGLYMVTLNITGSSGSSIYNSYVSKDGNLLFVSSVDISQTPEAPAEEDTTTPTEITKADKPSVKMFVMSYCPYGEQAETGLGPAVEAIGLDKISFEPHFVIYENYNGGGPNYCFDNESLYCSMHGINEIREDIRQLIIWKYWPDKWWAYVNKVNSDTSTSTIESSWEGISESVGLDASEIKEKFNSEALTLLAAEASLNAQYGVRGSPTVLINDVQYQGGRSSENYKTGICDAFTTAPASCGQTLNASASTTSGGCAA